MANQQEMFSPPRDSFDSDEWVIVHNEVQDPNDGRIDVLPSDTFPGTWEGALNEAGKAAKEVIKASCSYAGAIAGSGAGKAAKYLAIAAANTANVGALTAAKYVVDASGTPQNRLPTPIRNWLKGKDKIDEAKKRAQEAEKARQQRKIKAILLESGQVVEAETRSAPMSIPSSGPGPMANIAETPDSLSDFDLDQMRDYNAQRGYFGTPVSRPALRPLAGTGFVQGQGSFNETTPSHGTAIFKDLETPVEVRHELTKPLAAGFSPISASPPTVAPMESPYVSQRSLGELPFGIETPTPGSPDLSGRPRSTLFGSPTASTSVPQEPEDEEEELGA